MSAPSPAAAKAIAAMPQSAHSTISCPHDGHESRPVPATTTATAAAAGAAGSAAIALDRPRSFDGTTAEGQPCLHRVLPYLPKRIFPAVLLASDVTTEASAVWAQDARGAAGAVDAAAGVRAGQAAERGQGLPRAAAPALALALPRPRPRHPPAGPRDPRVRAAKPPAVFLAAADFPSGRIGR
eukprot:COSAG04_NODE_91_length_26852_cov_8.609315_13_plen_183_part_00